jgi:integrase
MIKQNNKSSFVIERHDVLGGRAEVLRTRASGNVYQLRMWIEKEQKYVRKSLKTKELEIARQRAEKQILETLGIISSGKKVFGVTVEELIKQFLEQKRKDAANGYITNSRISVLRTYLKHFAAYLRNNKMVGSLDSQSCFDYADWRKRENATVKVVTIKQEQTTINSVIKFAHQKKYVDFDTFQFRKIGKNTSETGRRGTFSDEEYNSIVGFLRSWVAKKNNVNDCERNIKLLVRDLFFAASNTMLRIGELLQLKWGDIEGYEKTIDDIGKSITLVRIRVRAETSKVRKERTITVRGGDYFKRIHSETKHKGKDNFIFCDQSTDKKIKMKILYHYWEQIMSGVGIDYKKRKITWYSCRHFGITCRLKAGASVYDIAQIAGTSVAQIEAHYGHFNQSMSRAASLRNYRYSKEGISVVE